MKCCMTLSEPGQLVHCCLTHTIYFPLLSATITNQRANGSVDMIMTYMARANTFSFLSSCFSSWCLRECSCMPCFATCFVVSTQAWSKWLETSPSSGERSQYYVNMYFYASRPSFPPSSPPSLSSLHPSFSIPPSTALPPSHTHHLMCWVRACARGVAIGWACLRLCPLIPPHCSQQCVALTCSVGRLDPVHCWHWEVFLEMRDLNDRVEGSIFNAFLFTNSWKLMKASSAPPWEGCLSLATQSAFQIFFRLPHRICNVYTFVIDLLFCTKHLMKQELLWHKHMRV